ncbi:hypothetical protein HDV04_005742 [Boothiomyces sp. JEL0838]|nr:hypothetical protein HDV04_005742 [Boothiomyces sp. JEL0838]
MDLTTLPLDIHHIIVQYLKLKDIRRLSFTCKFLYQFYTSLRQLGKLGVGWPIASHYSRFYRQLKEINMRGFKFKEVVLAMPLQKEMFTNLPPTDSITVAVWPIEDPRGCLQGNLEIEKTGFELMSSCKNIRKIVINYPDWIYESMSRFRCINISIAKRIFENLTVWKNLKILELAREDIEYSPLAKLLPMTNVTELKIGLGTGVRVLFPIIEFTKLKSLTLADCKLVDADLTQIAGYLEKWKIYKLSLGYAVSDKRVWDEYYNRFTDVGVVKLAESIPKSKIKELDLTTRYTNDLSFIAVKAVFDAVPKSNLLKIDLDNEEFYNLLAKNIKYSKLRKLRFVLPKAVSRLSALLMAISRHSTIKKINIKGENFGLMGFPPIVSPEEYCQVFSPYINILPFKKFYIDGIHHASMLIKYINKDSTIKVLTISPACEKVTEDLLKEMAKNIANSNIKEIYILNGIKWQSAEFGIIAEFFNCATLELIDISAEGISRTGFICLAEKLKQKSLTRQVRVAVSGTYQDPEKIINQILGTESLISIYSNHY